MVSDFLRRILSFIGFSDRADSESVQKLVHLNGLNRRKNLRVNYSHLGPTGPFPRVKYKGDEVIIANISVGGLLIIDDVGRFGDQVGEMIELELQWPDFSTRMRSRVVGAQLERRHIQFVDFNAPTFLRISQLVKPAYAGQRFHLVRNDSGALEALEMWLGPSNESLVFLESTAFAEYNTGDAKILFFRDQPPVYAVDNKPVPMAKLEEVFVTVANFKNATPTVKKLLEFIDDEFRNAGTRRTGTDG